MLGTVSSLAFYKVPDPTSAAITGELEQAEKGRYMELTYFRLQVSTGASCSVAPACPPSSSWLRSTSAPSRLAGSSARVAVSLFASHSAFTIADYPFHSQTTRLSRPSAAFVTRSSRPLAISSWSTLSSRRRPTSPPVAPPSSRCSLSLATVVLSTHLA